MESRTRPTAATAATAAPPVDPAAFKAAARAQWDRSAEGWDRHGPQIRAWLATATAAMIEMAGIRAGHHVLDVAAGAGDQTLDIAVRVGPAGRVLATDLSPEIVARARANAARAGATNVELLVADAETLDVPAGGFDAAVCRLGLMLMPQPARALAAMQRALRAGGGLAVVAFGRPERNPCVSLLMRTALRHAGLPPRDPFQPGGLLSLGRPALLDELVRDAGLREVATTALDAPFRLPSAAAYLEFVRNAGSPIQQILSRLAPAAVQAAWADMEQQLREFDTADGWAGPNELLLTAARR